MKVIFDFWINNRWADHSPISFIMDVIPRDGEGIWLNMLMPESEIPKDFEPIGVVKQVLWAKKGDEIVAEITLDVGIGGDILLGK